MLFIYPTETCYGLGCSAFDEAGIKKIYELKKRDSEKPLIVLVNSIEMWKSIAEVSPEALKLAEEYWPGPLTIIQPKKASVPDMLSKQDVAVRWSPHPIPNKLIKQLNAPIISTSANISGGKNPYSIDDIPRSIIRAVNKVIDIDELDHNPPSTIVIFENNKLVVLRKGSVNI
ncbi:MAG: threonylcarbamoyl-AMP synthase [Nanoarchaeota archaeon]|nr:threonylcarbamoyl-AMP synthase [Nanoarchaeota archaeon]